MGDVTDLYQIPYITDEDLVGSTPDVDKAQAERIDYLFSVNTGPDGKSAYDIYVESVQPPDTPLSEEDWLESLNGDVGASEYDKLLPAHQEPVELANTTFGHLLPHTSHAPLNYYPIGTVIEWAGTRIDNGWLWCDGKAYDYTKTGNEDLGALYSTIGNTYGGSGTLFAVPDKRTAANKCQYTIYAGGDTSAVTSSWQNPNVGEHLPSPTVAPLHAEVYAASNISYSRATPLNWTHVRDDNTGGAWSSGQPSRLVFPKDGMYLCIANLRWDVGTNNNMTQTSLSVHDGQGTVTSNGSAINGTFVYESMSTVAIVPAGAYLTVSCFNKSGGGSPFTLLANSSMNFTYISEIP